MDQERKNTEFLYVNGFEHFKTFSDAEMVRKLRSYGELSGHKAVIEHEGNKTEVTFVTIGGVPGPQIAEVMNIVENERGFIVRHCLPVGFARPSALALPKGQEMHAIPIYNIIAAKHHKAGEQIEFEPINL